MITIFCGDSEKHCPRVGEVLCCHDCYKDNCDYKCTKKLLECENTYADVK